MKSLVIFVFMVFCIATVVASSAFGANSSFRQSDRERLIKVETKLEDGLKATNQKIEDGLKATNQRIDDMKADMNKRFDQMYTLILWGFGILLGGMGSLMGFVLWDRRNAIAPAIRKTKEIEERAELFEKAIKEAAIDNPGLKEALKHFGLL
jgi:hypothetical protein